MFRLIVRRFAFGLLTIVLVSGIIFVGVEALPGDSCTAYLGRMAQGTRLDNCRRDFGLERPALTRYVDWALGAVRGDFGLSLKGKTPISEKVGTRFRNTVILGVAASMVGVPLAILLGIIAALWRDRPPDLWVSTTAICAMTIPEFVTSTVLILIFSVWLGWLPGIHITVGYGPICPITCYIRHWVKRWESICFHRLTLFLSE